MSVTANNSQNTEYRILVKLGDEELARQDAVKAAISAEAARLSAIAAGDSEQVATEKAVQTLEDAASALASKEDAESAATDSGGFASASNVSALASQVARVASVSAQGIATTQAQNSSTSAGQSDASAGASEAAKNLSVSAKDTAISKAAEANSSSITATTQAGISTGKAVESAQSAAQSLLSRNEAAAILANTLTGGAVAGQVSFWNGPKNLIGDSSFVWDNVNKRLGVNAVSPTESLDVNGRIRARLIDNGIGNFLTKSATGVIQERTPAQTRNDIGAVGGTGTTNFLPRFTANETIGNSQIFDDGSLLRLGNNANGGSTLVSISGYSLNGVNGSYGRLLLAANNNVTGSAKQFLVTNALNSNAFAIIRSVDALTIPTLSTSGTVTSGTADFVITSIGNVGIDNPAPAFKLDVNGTGNFTGNLSVAGRVRLSGTIDNATGDLATYSATGVLQKRTRLETVSDILTALPTYNAAISQTLTHNASGVIAWI